ncbi:hypothetical protein EBZ80_24525 [bacterium]|nr:hypothetical protein [bacterium]
MGPKKGPKGMMNNPMEKYLSKGSDKESLVESESGGGEVSFAMPSGFQIPDGVKDGEPFDAMATLMVKDGKLVLGELDGMPVGDEPEESETPETSEESPEAESPESDDSEKSSEDSEDSEEVADEANDSEEADNSLGFLDRVEKKLKKKKM